MLRLCTFVLLLLPQLVLASRFPSGVLDPGEKAAYVRVSDGILAIDLATGNTLWSSNEAHHPLFAVGDRLYCVALSGKNELRIVGFDLNQKGERVYRSQQIILPKWAISADKEGHSFVYQWTRDKEFLFLEWSVTVRGMFGPPKTASGRVRVDLRSGFVRTLPDAPAQQSQPNLKVLEKLSVRWQHVFAGRLHAVVLEELPESNLVRRSQRFVLRTWDERNEKPGVSRELMRGSRLEMLASLDNSTLWIRDAGTRKADDVAKNWSIFSSIDGSLAARALYIPGTRQVQVIGTRAYCLLAGPLRPNAAGVRVGQLAAVDLETGRPLWQRSLSRN